MKRAQFDRRNPAACCWPPHRWTMLSAPPTPCTQVLILPRWEQEVFRYPRYRGASRRSPPGRRPICWLSLARS